MIDRRRHFGELRLIAGNANPVLAQKIAQELDQPLENAKVGRFPDGEVQVDLDCVVRGTDVFIIQPICQSHTSPVKQPCLADGAPGGNRDDVCTYQSINDNLLELLVMIDAARRASAGRITAVVPYMAYAKQEKKKRGHEPIAAKLVANLITTAGADRLLTVDLHTPAIEGFFDIPVDHMRMAFVMGSYFRNRLAREDAVVVSPDAGGVARATEFRDHLKAGLDEVIAGDEMAIAFKRRTPIGQPTVIDMVGDVEGRPAVIYDDMIQSGGTLLQVVERLLERGATEVHAAAVHADFTPGALGRLENSPLKTLVLSDTTATAIDAAANKIQIVSSARILGQAIWRIYTQQSVGWIFETLRDEGELPPVGREGL
ncbi:MAG TPA: ribose-phosphate diphosphokinase [Anaerolineae bacterium]|nr:ribose-phosphate diphosphokinase [Anaerolineae bacterium]